MCFAAGGFVIELVLYVLLEGLQHLAPWLSTLSNIYGRSLLWV